MPRKKRKPTDDAEPTRSGPSPERPDRLADDLGESVRRSLPVIEEVPANWTTAVVTALLRVHARMERRMTEVIGRHGLTLAQFDVLATLRAEEGITQQELAERLLVTKGNVVGLVDRVCRAGWVERRDDPADRRANRLYLTDQGHQRLADTAPEVAGLRAGLLDVFTADELRQLHQFLRRLEDSITG